MHMRTVAVGIKLVGVPQPKRMHRFSPNFLVMFTPRGSNLDHLKLIRFGGYLSSNIIKSFFGFKG